jgi:hypothetical protein
MVTDAMMNLHLRDQLAYLKAAIDAGGVNLNPATGPINSVGGNIEAGISTAWRAMMGGDDTVGSYFANNTDRNNLSTANQIAMRLLADSAIPFRLQTSGTTGVGSARSWTDRIRVTNAGVIELPTGHILFPSSQNPSSNANTLDDYEEGNFTPQLVFGGGSVGMTFSTRIGSYIKVGKFVICSARMTLSAKGSSTGTATLSGWPFTSASHSGQFWMGPIWFDNLAASLIGMHTYIATGTTSADIRGIASAGNSSFGSLSDTAFGATSTLYFTLIYETSN